VLDSAGNPERETPQESSVFNVGPTEILVILLIALLVFGPKRLPEVGRTVGKGLREFRRATNEIRGDIESTLDDDEPAPPSTNGPAASTAPPSVAGETGPQASVTPEAGPPAEVTASDSPDAQPATADAPNPDGATSVA
jgi:sec-independent protein translocase protein TatA